MADVPDELSYTAEHEWVQATSGATVRVGITDHAQQALGDVVFVSLPEIGAAVTRGQAMGEVESTKSVSDLYAPVDGTVVARNEELDAQPDMVNSAPYAQGWIVEIEASDPAQLDTLLDAEAYRALGG